MSVPYWVQDQIFYQIFPDRFYNSDPSNDPPAVQLWGAEPTINEYQGGDLRGIIAKFDYLLDLGITALYLNPIFQSAANHRYHITDYYKIDPTLGTMADFRALLDVAHGNNVKVLLDGVFNHSGRGFFAFNDILENGEKSRYRDWYYVNGFPLEAFSPGKAERYKAWWDMKDLPKFNTDTPAVRKYLMDVSRYWIEQGIDGWRLDVPAEIDDDAFWAEWRAAVRAADPDAYTVGEVWEVNPRWVGEDHFDGLMHYSVRDSLLKLMTKGASITDFAGEVEGYLTAYPRENVYAMYVPLGSHDTRRLLTKLEGDKTKAKLATLFQFAYPGAPAIYYGDEIGMDGDKDPQNRRAFNWDESSWDSDLRGHIQKLVALRKRSAALRRGEYTPVLLDAEHKKYAFARTLGEEKVLVVINAHEDAFQVSVPVSELGWTDGMTVRDLLGSGGIRVEDGALQVTVPGWSGVLLG